MTRTTTLTLSNLPPATAHSHPSTLIASTRFASSKPQYSRYPSTPSVPYTALPSPILSHPLLDATEPFPEYIETMADFPDPANTLPPSAAAARLAAQQQNRTPLWERIFSPLLFVSFILGLYVVDSNNRDRSTSSMSSGSDWDDLNIGSTKKRRSNGKAEKGRPTNVSVASSTASDSNEATAWFWRAKRRRLAKMEIADALERRAFIAMVLVGLVVMAMSLAWWTGMNIWQFIADGENGAIKLWDRMV